MLNALAKQIWGGSPSKKNSAEINGRNDNGDTAPASFWLVEGLNPSMILDNVRVQVDDDKLTILDESLLLDEKKKKKNVNFFEFPFDKIANFRRHEVDMFQWTFKKSPKDTPEEYGLVLSSVSQASSLHEKINKKIIDKCNIIYSVNAEFYIYDRSTTEWKKIKGDACFAIRQRESDCAGYIVIYNNEDDKENENSIISHAIISNEIYFFPQIKDKVIAWWMSECTCRSEEEKEKEKEKREDTYEEEQERHHYMESKMFRVKFADEKTTTKVVNLIEIVLFENREGKKLDSSFAYKIEEDLGKNIHEDGEKNRLKSTEIRKKEEKEEEDENEEYVTHAQNKLYEQFGYNNDDFAMDICEEEEDKELTWQDDEEEFSPNTRKNLDESSSLRYKMMEVGKERTFVVRSNASAQQNKSKNASQTKMQVFGFDEYGRERMAGVVDGSKFHYGSDLIVPSKVLLHDGESKMLVMAEGNMDNVYMMDLEREQVVKKWDADGLNVRNLVAASRDSEGGGGAQDPRTFMAYNPQSVFFMDTRLDEHARTNTISYVSKVNFSCAATDVNGSILMGSSDGSLRLYDGGVNAAGKIKKAKTHLSGLGDPLLHTVVTKQGDWILATCAKYLALYPVRLSSTGKTGFTVSLGDKKPKPFILKIRMDDIIKYDLQNVNFTKADFNQDETAIITATDKLVIMWDFLAIKKGNLGSYSIRAVDDVINDVAFLKATHFDTVVLATPLSLSTRPLKRKSKE